MSMSHNKQFSIVKNQEGYLLSLQRQCIEEHWTSVKWREKYNTHIEFNPVDPKLPNHYKEYLRGFATALRESLYYVHVFNMHEYEGKLYKNWNDLPEEAKEAERTGKIDLAMHSGFYWKDSHDKF